MAVLAYIVAERKTWIHGYVGVLVLLFQSFMKINISRDVECSRCYCCNLIYSFKSIRLEYEKYI